MKALIGLSFAKGLCHSFIHFTTENKLDNDAFSASILALHYPGRGAIR